MLENKTRMVWRKYFKPPRGFKLTKAGRIFFVFLFAIIAVAMLTGNNLLFMILAFMLAFMIVSGLESERNIRYLEIERVLPSEIYAHTPSRIGYHLRNTRLTSDRLVINSLGGIKVACLPKGPGEIYTTEYAFERRGRQHLGDVQVYTTFPYGLFEKSITFALADDIVVFPEPMPVSSAAALGREDSGRGKGTDSISHVRPYIPGDSGSLIVWKKLHLGLFSRVVEGGSGLTGVIVLLPGGELEEKLSQAAFLVGELFTSGGQFGLAAGNYFSGLAGSRDHKIKILTYLADLDVIGAPSPAIDYGTTKLIYL